MRRARIIGAALALASVGAVAPAVAPIAAPASVSSAPAKRDAIPPAPAPVVRAERRTLDRGAGRSAFVTVSRGPHTWAIRKSRRGAAYMVRV